MADKPTYEELARRVKELENDAMCQQRENKQGAGEERFWSLPECVPHFIHILDKTGRIVETNSTIRQLGFGREDLVGKRLDELFTVSSRKIFEREFPILLKMGWNRQEVELVSKDGAIVAVDCFASVVRDDRGGVKGIIVLQSDMAERKHGEEALRESEEKYRMLTESSFTGVFIHQDGKYVYVNDRFAEIHGYKTEELIGMEYRTLMQPEEREALTEIAQKRLEGASVSPLYQVRRVRKDGTTVWCEMMATRIEYWGRPAIMGNIVDITKRKHAEEGLRESEKLLYQEERRVELLKFANDVALKLMHELRNPLVSIGGFSRRISTSDCPEDKLKEYTRIIFDECMRLDNVLNKVLVHLKGAAHQALTASSCAMKHSGRG